MIKKIIISSVFCVMALPVLAEAVPIYIKPPVTSSGTGRIIYANIHIPGDIVAKPTCDTGTPKIYVSPAIIKAADSGYALMGFKVWAQDGGTFWTVRGEVRSMEGGANYPRSMSPYDDSVYVGVFTTCN